jgi:dTMP kinase
VSRRRGRFLVLEGLDGAGTTTPAAILAARLVARGRRVHLTSEPSAGPVGRLVRRVLRGTIAGGDGRPLDQRALALLFAADRVDHLAGEVEPRLASGVDVVSDRYALSSLAYQSAATGDLAWVEAINQEAPAPDLTIFLEVRPAVALRRRYAASAEREIYEVPAFQRRVAAAYRRALRRLRARGERVAVVDGEPDVEAVADAVDRAARALTR